MEDIDTQVKDMVAAADDATRPPGRCALGRPLARKQIMEARRALRELIFATEKGIDGPTSG